jgi:hypothetical protein
VTAEMTYNLIMTALLLGAVVAVVAILAWFSR